MQKVIYIIVSIVYVLHEPITVLGRYRSFYQEKTTGLWSSTLYILLIYAGPGWPARFSFKRPAARGLDPAGWPARDCLSNDLDPGARLRLRQVVTGPEDPLRGEGDPAVSKHCLKIREKYEEFVLHKAQYIKVLSQNVGENLWLFWSEVRTWGGHRNL